MAVSLGWHKGSPCTGTAQAIHSVLATMPEIKDLYIGCYDSLITVL
jgi:hypothetical protein